MHISSYNLIDRAATQGRRSRAGVAPLEMVMCMGIFVPMFMLAFFVGVFFVQAADLTATVRNEAWHKRYTEARSKQYDFQEDQTLVAASGDRTIGVVAFLKSYAQPRSKHAVLGDAWDARPDSRPAAKERFEELNEHWNKELQLELAVLAGENTLGSALGALQSAGSQLASVADIAQAAADALTGGFKSQLESAANAAQQKLNDQVNEAKEELRGQIEQLNQQIDDIQRQITDKTGQLNDARNRLNEIDQKLRDPNLPEAERTALNQEKTAKEADIQRLGPEIDKLGRDKASREKSRSALQKALDS